jgi:lycopene cyclase CruA
MIKKILYLEIPTPDIAHVWNWSQVEFQPSMGEKLLPQNGWRYF